MAFSGYQTFEQQIRLREGLGRCFDRASNIVTRLTCYEDDSYRRKMNKCPYYISLEDEGTRFTLSADLGQDSMQYDGSELAI